MQPPCTAPLIFNAQQGGIANPTKPDLVCPCSDSFTVNYLPRGNAAFDVQASEDAGISAKIGCILRIIFESIKTLSSN